MEKYPDNKIKRLLISATCGVLSFVINFVIIPQTVALPDPIWMILMLLIPILIAIFLFRKVIEMYPAYIWVGLPVQYLLLCIFSNQISKTFGINIVKGTGGFEYIFIAAVWPFAVTLAQFFVLMVLCWKRKSK